MSYLLKKENNDSNLNNLNQQYRFLNLCGCESIPEQLCSFIATFNNVPVNPLSSVAYVPAFQGINIGGIIYSFPASLSTLTIPALNALVDAIEDIFASLGYPASGKVGWRKNKKSEIEIFTAITDLDLKSLYSIVKPFPSSNFKSTCQQRNLSGKITGEFNVKTTFWQNLPTQNYTGGALNSNPLFFISNIYASNNVEIAKSYRFQLRSLRIFGGEQLGGPVTSPDIKFMQDFDMKQSEYCTWFNQNVSNWLNTLPEFKNNGIVVADNGGLVYTKENIDFDFLYIGQYMDKDGIWKNFQVANRVAFGYSKNFGYGSTIETANTFDDIPLPNLTNQVETTII